MADRINGPRPRARIAPAKTEGPAATSGRSPAQPETASAQAPRSLHPQAKAFGKRTRRGSGAFGARSSAGAAGLRGAGALVPSRSPQEISDIVDVAHRAMKASGPFGTGIGTDKEALLASVTGLQPSDAKAVVALYAQRHGATPQAHVAGEGFLKSATKARITAYLDGDPTLGDALGLNAAFDAGDAAGALNLLRGADATGIEALKDVYVGHFGRDLEYDMRGFAADLQSPIDFDGSLTLPGLTGDALKTGLGLLHDPRLQATAVKLAELIDSGAAQTPDGQKALYGLVALEGGEHRNRLATLFNAHTGNDFGAVVGPLLRAAAQANGERPLTSPAETTVAVVVSSGNWKQLLSGEHDSAIGGYHWREIEAYVKEALDRGYTPVIFTPDGLPPSPDALSLLEAKIGPKVGFGLRPGTGPESPQGEAIVSGFLQARPMSAFDADDFITMHVAGGHGSHHDLVGHPEIERAALDLNAAGKAVTGVCHATPSLGSLLEGQPATGFSPTIDAMMLRAGYVLDEFNPPYDAHAGLKDLGAKLTVFDRAQSLVNVHHTERFEKNGAPVITGTGPEATDNVARQAFDWIESR